jgi:hypothetical protein
MLARMAAKRVAKRDRKARRISSLEENEGKVYVLMVTEKCVFMVSGGLKLLV